MKKLANIALPLAVAVLLLGAWEIAVAHWQVPVYVLPAPSAIAAAFANGLRPIPRRREQWRQPTAAG